MAGSGKSSSGSNDFEFDPETAVAIAGTTEEDAAATKLQAVQRGRIARTKDFHSHRPGGQSIALRRLSSSP